MKQYYAIKVENVHTLMKFKDEIMEVNLQEFFKQYLVEEKPESPKYLDEVNKGQVMSRAPKYLIAEARNDEFYEAYTGVRIARKDTYNFKTPLYYTEENISGYKVGAFAIHEHELSQYVQDWVIDNDKKLEVLNLFIKYGKITQELFKYEYPNNNKVLKEREATIVNEFQKQLIKNKK